jgi:hypothetical protein
MKSSFCIDGYVANGTPERIARVRSAIESAYPDAAVEVYGGARNVKDSAECIRKPGSRADDGALDVAVTALIKATL